MDYLVITKKRMQHHIEYDIRKHARGVLNWFIDENNLLNVLITVQGVNYVYRTDSAEIDEDLKWQLTSNNEVLGVLDIGEEEEEEVDKPAVLTFQEIFNTGVVR